jgi:hypothetical protein
MSASNSKSRGGATTQPMSVAIEQFSRSPSGSIIARAEPETSSRPNSPPEVGEVSSWAAPIAPQTNHDEADFAFRFSGQITGRVERALQLSAEVFHEHKNDSLPRQGASTGLRTECQHACSELGDGSRRALRRQSSTGQGRSESTAASKW